MKPRTQASITMALVLLAILMMFPQAPLHAGSRRRAVAVSPPSSDLNLTFLDGPVLDTGPIVWRGDARGTTIVMRTITLRIGVPSSQARGTATLRAFLELADPRVSVRIDGVLLGATPRIVQMHAPIGIAVRHTVEFEIPTNATEGAFMSSLSWEATTD